MWELLTGKMVAQCPRAPRGRGVRGGVAGREAPRDRRLRPGGLHLEPQARGRPRPAARPAGRRRCGAGLGSRLGPGRRPGRAEAACAERFPPVAEPKPETIQGWIADLDHATFSRREEASAALAKAGPSARAGGAAGAAGQADARGPPAAGKGPGRHQPPADGRATWSTRGPSMPWNWPDTEAARKVLAEWADGVEGTWLSADARAALRRTEGPVTVEAGPPFAYPHPMASKRFILSPGPDQQAGPADQRRQGRRRVPGHRATP